MAKKGGKGKGKGKGGRCKTAATLTIHGPGRMTARGRRDIADWLRRNAALLAKDQLTDGRFRAGFHYG